MARRCTPTAIRTPIQLRCCASIAKGGRRASVAGTVLAIDIHSYARSPLWQTDEPLTKSTGSATRVPASSCTDGSPLLPWLAAVSRDTER